MTHTDPSRQLSLMEDTGEFFFELDSFLQCVSERGFDSFSFDPSAAAAVPDGFVDAGGAGFKAEMLREEETSGFLLTGGGVEMAGAPSVSASEFGQQHGSTVSDPYLGNSGDGFAMWQLPQSIAGPMVASSHQPQPEDISARVPVQPAIKQGNHATVPAPDVPKPKNQNQNLSRKRQREELAHLRVSVQELQLQLETLLNRDASEGAEDHPATERPSQKKKKMLALLAQTLAWKRAASDEKVQSEQAAAESMKLRALVEGNIQVCKNLREACSKSGVSRVPYGGFQYDYAELKKPTRFNTVSDSAIFASLHEGLDAQYQRVGTVWAECDFTNSSVEIRGSNRLRSNAHGDVYLEHTQSHVFPFTAESVGRSIWKLTKSGLFTPTIGELKMCRVMGNTLYATLVDTIPISSSKASSIKAWIALKRFIDTRQVVMVFQGHVEIEHPTKRVIQVTESGWNVVQSLANVDTTKKNQIHGLNMAPCASQTCIRSLPGQNCAAGADEFADDSPTATVLNQFHDNMGLLNQTIENFLLDESMASSSVGGSGSRCGSFSAASTRHSGKSESVA